MNIEKPTIVHKYITLFSTEDAYNEAYPNFSEANWSDVGYPEDTPDNYRLSRRLSNMYHKDNPPEYKFNGIDDKVVEQKEELEKDDDGNWQIVYRDVDIYPDAHRSANYRLLDYSDNCIRKTFFLEVVWGYFGWEWVDYRRTLEDETEEILTGGNLYTIKEMGTVPHIIDGHRLYHINDFLNSQDKVTVVEDFATTNLKAMNRAFKRINRQFGSGTTPPNVVPLALKVYNFPNAEEADNLFYNNKITVISDVDGEERYNEQPILLPSVKEIDGIYRYGVFVDGLKFQFDNAEKLTNSFIWSHFPTQTDFNLTDIFVGDTLKKTNDLSGLLEMAVFYTGKEKTGYTKPVNEITIDLSGSSLSASDEFNLSNLAYWSQCRYFKGAINQPMTDRYFLFDITLKGKTNLSSAFRRIMQTMEIGGANLGWRRVLNAIIDGEYISGWLTTGGPTNIEIDFNETQNLITNFDYALAENRFIEAPPFTAWINDTCSENYLYYRGTFNEGVTYDFSPNHILNPSEGQFNDCYINPTKTISFDNVDALKNVRFQNITFGTETITVDGQQITRNIGIPFPYNYDLCNFQKYQYNDDPEVLYRFINFSGSMFTELKANQDIYITGKSAASMFNGCSRIDFAGSNIKLYIGPTYNSGEQWNNTTWTTFQNCSSMTKTPKIIDSYVARKSGNQGDVLTNMFQGCTNLTHIDAADFSGVVYGFHNSGCPTYIDLRSCKNLVYLDMGDIHGGFNLKGLYNLDIPTLSTTLLRQTYLGDAKYTDTGLEIQQSVWEALQEYDLEYNKNTISYIEGLPYRRIVVWSDTDN